MRNKVKRTDNGVTVEFTGTVVSNDDMLMYRYLDWDCICPKDIEDAIGMAEGKPILLRMNSPGGAVYVGAEIYTRLMEYSGPITVDILSISASAASVVAMITAKEGNHCRISPLGMMMIHNIQTKAQGDYRDMECTAELLRKANSTIIDAYKRKTGIPEAKLQEMLDKETYLTAKEAVELGFADEVMFEADQPQTDPGTMTAVMARTRELINAIPSLDASTIRRMVEAQRTENAKREKDREMEASLQLATMQLELEKNRFKGGNPKWT